jgi:hypothetical protein
MAPGPTTQPTSARISVAVYYSCISPTTGPQPSHLRWNDAKSELPVLIVFNFRSVACLPCGATVAHPSCSRFRRYEMVVVFCRDNPHVSYRVRTPAEKPGHDVLALPVSALAQMPGVRPNFQPLFECEFERNAAAFGAVLVLIVFLFPFAHVRTILVENDPHKMPRWRHRGPVRGSARCD